MKELILELEGRIEEAKVMMQKLQGTYEFMDKCINELQEGIFDAEDGKGDLSNLYANSVILSHLVKFLKPMLGV